MGYIREGGGRLGGGRGGALVQGTVECVCVGCPWPNIASKWS